MGKAVSLISESVNSILGETLVKIIRQLNFYYDEQCLTPEEFTDVTKRLVISASVLSQKEPFQVPKVRYGRTELMIPIVTCGGMRVQQTWLPDFVPLISPSPKKVLAGKSQENLKILIKECLKVGINHFETARFYGTSELQFVDALSTMIESGKK